MQNSALEMHCLQRSTALLVNLQIRSDLLLRCQSSFVLTTLINVTLQNHINKVLSTCGVHDGVTDLKSIIWGTPKWSRLK